MISTSIQIEHYLAEYMTGKYNNMDKTTPLKLPDNCDLYHFIYDLMSKRPADCSFIDSGNLSFYLPCRYTGKNPEVYNYFSKRGTKMLRAKIMTAFKADLHDFVNEQYYKYGVFYKDAIHLFMSKYGIESIEENSLWKNYSRWKNKQKKYRKNN